MKAQIHDAAALRQLKPDLVRPYLLSRGWIEKGSFLGGAATIWQAPPTSRERREFLLPSEMGFADYAQRISDLLGAIARVEDRSELPVFDDIFRASMDAWAIRSKHPDSADGSIPLREGVKLVENALGVMNAAACAAESPRASFTNPPRRAAEYSDALRLGQTSRGSYVVNLFSPLRLDSDLPAQLTLPGVPTVEPPAFGRNVTQTLVRALSTTREAVAKAEASRSVDHFIDTVSDGVSRNLLSSLTGLITSPLAAVELSVRWAPVQQAPSQPKPFLFGPRDLEWLDRAQNRLRAEAPPKPIELTGHVVQVNRTSEALGDLVALECEIAGKEHRVVLDLFGDDYKRALRAMKDRKRLIVTGVLGRAKGRLTLHGVEGVGIERKPRARSSRG